MDALDPAPLPTAPADGADAGSSARALFVFPERLRVWVRRREVGLVVLALAAGIAAGAMVTAIAFAAQAAHVLFFGIRDDQRLSAAFAVPVLAALGVPTLGGVALALLTAAVQRWRPRRPVDPIEANALQGGRMSIADSLVVGAQTLLSNAVGASVGLEAAYTQLGSGFASRIGAAFRLRRADMRVLVGCGSAGAIAAAFGAPLTGAFYAFEIVLAAYSVATFAPVAVAAIAGALTAHMLGLEHYTMDTALAFVPSLPGFTGLMGEGLLCALGAIAIMQGVTATEAVLRRSRIPAFFLPAVGGLAVGVLALVTPRVLSAGHGALIDAFSAPTTTPLLLLGVIVLKALASAISLGAGFRGGLFFASLLLGALLGQFYAQMLAFAAHAPPLDPLLAALAGMAALAAAIVGGPLTMSFLVLEMTGDFRIAVAVLVAVVTASTAIRETFGYSFATWRFHVRGEAIRSAHDVGWMRDLTVGALMRRDVPRVPDTTGLDRFRAQYPLGAAQRVIAVSAQGGAYAGLVNVVDAHQDALDAKAATMTIADILVHRDHMLTAAMNIQEAARRFEDSESDALAVVDATGSRKVVGLLTEAHALRRYSEELDKARRDLSGDRT